MTLLAGDDPDQLHNTLGLAGFRRSQDLAYRPACDGCDACVPIRVIARDFQLNKSFKRVWNKNTGVKEIEKPALATTEHYELFQKYLGSRHADGGMMDMDFDDYKSMVEESPVRTLLMEYRLPDGELYAVCLTDMMNDGLSLVYSFYDPAYADMSPGTYLILWHIRRAQLMSAPHVYLGYWISESQKMYYKKRFQPAEILIRNNWQSFEK